jgi:hypothetical protein
MRDHFGVSAFRRVGFQVPPNIAFNWTAGTFLAHFDSSGQRPVNAALGFGNGAHAVTVPLISSSATQSAPDFDASDQDMALHGFTFFGGVVGFAAT